MLALLKRYRLVISEVALALGAATRLNVWVRTNHVNMGEGWLWPQRSPQIRPMVVT
jgi:hypothetical protein